MTQGVYVIKKHLADARRAIRSCRVALEGAEDWLDGDDMVVVQHIWDRALLELRIEHLGQLEDTFAGLLALCEEMLDRGANHCAFDRGCGWSGGEEVSHRRSEHRPFMVSGMEDARANQTHFCSA